MSEIQGILVPFNGGNRLNVGPSMKTQKSCIKKVNYRDNSMV